MSGSSSASGAPSAEARGAVPVDGPDVQLVERLRGWMRDAALLDRALTHGSHASAQAGGDYERLEFLGDAVLGLVVVEHLYRRFPDVPEGGLTRMKARLVSARQLAVVSERFGLLARARLGRSEQSDPARARSGVGQDLVEAVIGAVYLDGGLEAARELVLHMFSRLLDGVHAGTARRDHKTELQELLQGALQRRPAYEVAGREGPDHAPVFVVEVRLDEQLLGAGRGSSRKAAEQEAAADALARMRDGVWSVVQLGGGETGP